jgi:hypothetical protein
MVDWYQTSYDPTLEAAEWAVALGGSINVTLGFWTGGLATFIQALFSTFHAACDFVFSDDWTEDFNQVLVCTLKDNVTITDGVATFSWQEVLWDLCGFILPVIDEHIKVRWQVYYILQVIGADGLDLAGQITAVDEPCLTCDEWCVSLTPEEALDYGLNITKGYVNVDGQGKESYGDGWYEFIAYLTVDTSQCVITQVGMVTARWGAGVMSNYTLWFTPTDTSNYQLWTANGGGDETRWSSDNPACSSNSDSTEIRWTTGASGEDKNMTVRNLMIRGTGINPFAIGSNC